MIFPLNFHLQFLWENEKLFLKSFLKIEKSAGC